MVKVLCMPFNQVNDWLASISNNIPVSAYYLHIIKNLYHINSITSRINMKIENWKLEIVFTIS